MGYKGGVTQARCIACMVPQSRCSTRAMVGQDFVLNAWSLTDDMFDSIPLASLSDSHIPEICIPVHASFILWLVSMLAFDS